MPSDDLSRGMNVFKQRLAARCMTAGVVSFLHTSGSTYMSRSRFVRNMNRDYSVLLHSVLVIIPEIAARLRE